MSPMDKALDAIMKYFSTLSHPEARLESQKFFHHALMNIITCHAVRDGITAREAVEIAQRQFDILTRPEVIDHLENKLAEIRRS